MESNQSELNSYTTEFRQYNPALGRWLSIDPVPHPWQSPYCAMDNNPVNLIDPDGLASVPTGFFAKIGNWFKKNFGKKEKTSKCPDVSKGSKVAKASKSLKAAQIKANAGKSMDRFAAKGWQDIINAVKKEALNAWKKNLIHIDKNVEDSKIEANNKINDDKSDFIMPEVAPPLDRSNAKPLYPQVDAPDRGNLDDDKYMKDLYKSMSDLDKDKNIEYFDLYLAPDIPKFKRDKIQKKLESYLYSGAYIKILKSPPSSDSFFVIIPYSNE